MRNIPIMKPYFTQDEADAAAEALASGWVAQGPKVAEFEEAVAAYEGVKFGIAATSCTTALHLAVIGMGLKPGEDVLLPSYTFVATANAIAYSGATPVLIDVRTDTYNIDTSKLEKVVETQYEEKANTGWFNRKTGNKLAGIVPVHLFGLCADIYEVNRIAKKYGLWVLEDSACALGARIGDIREGSFGNPSCLSFHPRKSITTGEGGMVLCNNESMSEKLKGLRSHGASVSEIMRHQNKGFLLPDYDALGFNYRMTDIQAAIGIAQMKKIDFICGKRREIAERYDKTIPTSVRILKIPFVPENYFHAYQSYVCMLDRREIGIDDIDKANEYRNKLMDLLEQNGIATRQGTHAVHTLGYYKNKYGYKPQDLPGAYKCDRLSIALPLYADMSEDDQDYCIEMLAKLSKKI